MHHVKDCDRNMHRKCSYNERSGRVSGKMKLEQPFKMESRRDPDKGIKNRKNSAEKEVKYIKSGKHEIAFLNH